MDSSQDLLPAADSGVPGFHSTWEEVPEALLCPVGEDREGQGHERSNLITSARPLEPHSNCCSLSPSGRTYGTEPTSSRVTSQREVLEKTAGRSTASAGMLAPLPGD